MNQSCQQFGGQSQRWSGADVVLFLDDVAERIDAEIAQDMLHGLDELLDDADGRVGLR